MRATVLISLLGVVGCAGESAETHRADGSGGAQGVPAVPPEQTGGESSGGAESAPKGSGGALEVPGSGGDSTGGADASGGTTADGGSTSGGASTGGQGMGGETPGVGGDATAGAGGLEGNPLVTEGFCEDQSQTVLEVPPGQCAQVWGVFEMEFSPECTAYPATTCTDWDYQVEHRCNVPSSTETLFLYVNRRADCGIQWDVRWCEGQCPEI